MIKVMSFNIRYGLADDGANHWHNRKSLALARIRAFEPDLLGLQDVDGAGLGASHQTGWTSLAIRLVRERREILKWLE